MQKNSKWNRFRMRFYRLRSGTEPFKKFPVSAALFAISACSGICATNVYVSPTGNDANDGKTVAKPVATLAHARDVMRNLRAGNTSVSGTIWLAGGRYFLTQPLVLTAADSNVTWMPSSSAVPRIIGGVALTKWSLVTSPSLLAKLNPLARGRAFSCSLTAAKVSPGTIQRRSANWDYGTVSGLELFVDGSPATIASYPNNFGYIPVIPIVKTRGAVTFRCSDPHVLAAAGKADLWAHGFFGTVFCDSIEGITAIDATKGTVTLQAPGPYYGFDNVGKWRLENVLSEMDSAGEYCVDRAGGNVYVIPTSGAKEYLASVLEAPLVQLQNASGVHLQGLNIEVGRSSGVSIDGGSSNVVDTCVVRNFGRDGVEIRSGYNNGIKTSLVTGTGEVGVLLAGGDRPTLTPANNYAQDTAFTGFQRDVRSYRPGILIQGVGNRVSRCTLSDSPGQAIIVHGNNHTVENCEISRVLSEMGDNGAVYMGRNVTERGNVVRNNLFHEIYSPAGFPAFYYDNYCVYLDDLESGFSVTGNVFTNTTCGVLLGGGRDNMVSANVFNNVQHPIEADARGLTAGSYYTNGTFDANVKEVNAFGSLYLTAYPELKSLQLPDHLTPYNNQFWNNTGPQNWLTSWSPAVAGGCFMTNNLLGIDPMFVNPSAYDFSLKPSSPASGLGLPQLTKAKVGAPAAVSQLGAQSMATP